MAGKLELVEQGAFPNHIDPWAEKGRYFHQIHAQMIGYLLDQIQRPIYERGYVAGRESSIQITTAQPDIFVEKVKEHPPKNQKYSQVAASLELEAGTYLAQPELELDRLFIQSLDTGALVTVIEFVSPNNKIRQSEMMMYQSRRRELWRSVNIVEIDLTRSVKRLLDDPITEHFPYHIAIYPVDEAPYFIGMNLTDAPKTFALPLQDDAYPVELNSVYRKAYASLLIAAQIEKAGDYNLESLPFPSIIGESDRQKLMSAIQEWRSKLSQKEPE